METDRHRGRQVARGAFGERANAARVVPGRPVRAGVPVEPATAVDAAADGVVAEVNAGVGDAVEAKDLIIKLRA